VIRSPFFGLTGFGVKIMSWIIELSVESSLLALVLSEGVVLILGMGLPTTAA